MWDMWRIKWTNGSLSGYFILPRSVTIPLLLPYSYILSTTVSIFSPMAQQLLVGQIILITEDSRSHSCRHTTLGRTPLDKWSVRFRDLHLTTHNIHKREISMHTAGFEPAIPASKRPQTLALDSARDHWDRPTICIVSVNDSVAKQNSWKIRKEKNVQLHRVVRRFLCHEGNEMLTREPKIASQCIRLDSWILLIRFCVFPYTLTVQKQVMHWYAHNLI
jgi:hypothetical protein